jgi:17beta-estradiol 17-dehydrogenase / very-long-chain 3-oxoacyl-CoA reductase
MQGFTASALCLLGAISAIRLFVYLCHTIASFVISGNGIQKYYRKGAYAIVTGASYGIGAGFALELAKEGFNLVLLARTQSKLEQVAEQARKLGVQVITLPFDFEKATVLDYEALGQKLKPLDITVLINNVGVAKDANEFLLTRYFFNPNWVSAQDSETIITVNTIAQVKMTHLVLPQLVNQKHGLIVNVGSLSAVAPSPLLSVYGASKSFLQHWSVSLSLELKNTGVHVEYLHVGFVATAMSKIRRTSLLVPSPESLAECTLKSIGHCYENVPFFGHKLMYYSTAWLPKSILARIMHFILVEGKRRAGKRK